MAKKAPFKEEEWVEEQRRRADLHNRALRHITDRWPNPAPIDELRQFFESDVELKECLAGLERSGLVKKEGNRYWASNATLAPYKKMMKCENCGATYEVKGYYHSGFSSLFYLYCSLDTAVLTIDEWDPQIWSILRSTESSVLGDKEQSIVEEQLIKCECGGTFSFKNPLRCAACKNTLLEAYPEHVHYAVLGRVVNADETNVWKRWASEFQNRWRLPDGKSSKKAVIHAMQSRRIEELQSVAGSTNGYVDLRGIDVNPSMGEKTKTMPFHGAPWTLNKYLSIDSAVLTQTDFSNSEFKDVELAHCNIEDCCFRSSRFIRLRNIANRFQDVDFRNCLFTDSARNTMSIGCSDDARVTEYLDCDLSESLMYMAWGINPSFEHCNLQNIEVVHCDFVGVSFSDCKLSGVLSYVDFRGVDSPPEGMEPGSYGEHVSNINNLDLSHCELDDVSFSTDYDLSGVKFPRHKKFALVWHPMVTLRKVQSEFGPEFIKAYGDEWKSFIDMEIGKESRRQSTSGLLRILNKEVVFRQWRRWTWLPETIDLLVKVSRDST